MPPELVCVKTFQYQHEADLLAGYLRSQGIQAEVTSDQFGGYGPWFLYSSGDPVGVVVPRAEADQACACIERYLDQQDQ